MKKLLGFFVLATLVGCFESATPVEDIRHISGDDDGDGFCDLNTLEFPADSIVAGNAWDVFPFFSFFGVDNWDQVAAFAYVADATDQLSFVFYGVVPDEAGIDYDFRPQERFGEHEVDGSDATVCVDCWYYLRDDTLYLARRGTYQVQAIGWEGGTSTIAVYGSNLVFEEINGDSGAFVDGGDSFTVESVCLNAASVPVYTLATCPWEDPSHARCIRSTEPLGDGHWDRVVACDGVGATIDLCHAKGQSCDPGTTEVPNTSAACE